MKRSTFALNTAGQAAPRRSAQPTNDGEEAIVPVTIAVCYFCGATKFGSFNKCDTCHQTPTTDEQAAWSLVCSDHHFPIETLNQISSDMRTSGVQPKLDPETLLKVLPAVRSALAMIRPSPSMAAAQADQHRLIKDILSGARSAKETPKADPPPLQTIFAQIRESLSSTSSAKEVLKPDPPPSTLAQIGRRTVGYLGVLVFGAVAVFSFISWFVGRVGPGGAVLDGWGRHVYEAPFWLRLAEVDHWRGLGWWLFDGAAFWISFGIGCALVSFGFSPRRNGRKQGG
jgi:hypothetical protein